MISFIVSSETSFCQDMQHIILFVNILIILLANLFLSVKLSLDDL